MPASGEQRQLSTRTEDDRRPSGQAFDKQPEIRNIRKGR
jgi:hypothetical protein